MARIPLPQRLPQPGSSGAYTAPNVVPFQDQIGEQMQDLGRGIIAGGVGAARIGDAEATRIRAARLKETDALQSESLRKIVGDYRLLQGKAAVDGRKAAEDAVTKAIKETEALLGDDAGARELFSGASTARRLNILGTIDAHHAAQARAYEIGESDARVRALSSDAVTFWQDPPPAPNGAPHSNPGEMYRAAALRELDDYVKQTGMGPEQAKIARQKVLTDIHGSRVEGMVRGQRADRAVAYLQSVPASDIEPDRRAELQRLVQTATIQDRSTRLAMQITAEAAAPSPPAPPSMAVQAEGVTLEATTFDETLRQAGREAPPREPVPPQPLLRYGKGELDRMFQAGEITAVERDATWDRLVAEDAFQRQERARGTVDNMATAERWLVDNPLRPVSALPPDVYNALARDGKLGELNTFATSRRYTTDFASLQEVTRRAEAGELRGTSLVELRAEFRGKLDDSDLKYAEALHAHANKVETPEQTEIVTQADRVKEWAKRLNILPRKGDATPAQDAQFVQAREKVQGLIRTFEQRAKRKATPEELQKVLDHAAMDRVWETAGIDELVSVYSLTRPDPYAADPVLRGLPDQEADAYVVVGNEQIPIASVPPGQRELINEALLAEGEFPTQEAIVREWVNKGRPKDKAKK